MRKQSQGTLQGLQAVAESVVDDLIALMFCVVFIGGLFEKGNI